jgi:hypothetical protein
MNCNQRLLQLYIDDGAEEPAATLLVEHLKSCGPCRRELTRLKALDWDLRSRPAAMVPVELGAMRRTALDACFAEAAAEKVPSFGATDLLSLQAGIWQGSTAFMSCLPGSSALRESVRKRRKPAKKQSVLRSLLRRAIGF